MIGVGKQWKQFNKIYQEFETQVEYMIKINKCWLKNAHKAELTKSFLSAPINNSAKTKKIRNWTANDHFYFFSSFLPPALLI